MTASPDDCLARNEWSCGEYLGTRREILLDAVGRPRRLTALSVLTGPPDALPPAVLARRWGWAAGPVPAVTTVLRTIPPPAMFSLLLPVYGLSAALVVATFAVLVPLLLTPVGNWGEGPTVVASYCAPYRRCSPTRTSACARSTTATSCGRPAGWA